jgi:hypothetical protein
MLLDLLGIVESLLLDGFLFDLFENAQLRYDFRVHALEVSRCTHHTLAGSLTLSRALRKTPVRLRLHGIHTRAAWVLEVVGPDTV